MPPPATAKRRAIQPVEQVALRLDHVGDGDQREARPVGWLSGASDDGPVLPWQPPITFEHSTK